MNTTTLSRLMRMSWEIQRRRHTNRSKALLSAWVILKNDDIAVGYLHAKHSTRHSKPMASKNFTLFNF
ncbi:hypothetical protein KTO58_05505 [Chitinophaga pendula]|uniref:hypothetical protein n=1 Tax=Chitinophaga TaxID=79328 RepID=UPI0012FDC323|nr:MULTISPECIES: hypothetical protein [Chitinophaga]UCJ08643.1 hypothetical protein KTO58_05505 [Chitinophaga pendula]